MFLGLIGSALLGIGKKVVGGHLVGGGALGAVNGVENAVERPRLALLRRGRGCALLDAAGGP